MWPLSRLGGKDKMYIGSDVSLRGDLWNEMLEKLKPVINTNYGVYILSVAIGIYEDQQLELLPATLPVENYFVIGRPMLHNNSHMLDLLFKAAIITTNLVDYSEDARMELAFNDESKPDFNRMTFLTKFANYGLTKLADKLTGDALENIENINKFVSECAAGLSFGDLDLDDLDLAEIDLEEKKA